MISCLELQKNNSVNAPGAHISVVYGDVKLFNNPRTNNHLFTATSAQILLKNYYLQSFENPPLKITVSLHQVPRFFGVMKMNSPLKIPKES